METVLKYLKPNILFLLFIALPHLQTILATQGNNGGYNSWNNNNQLQFNDADRQKDVRNNGGGDPPKFCNARFVLDYYRQVFVEKNVDAADNYLSPDYIQHNPSLPDGREALKSAAREWFRRPWTSTLLRHGADGDLVWIHTRTEADFLREVLGGNGTTAAVDIYRLENQRIVEHWDVIQLLPDKSQNAHPLF